MKKKLRFLGMDVHAETIAAAIVEPDGEVRSLGTIPNRMESLRKLIKKLGPVKKLRVCYGRLSDTEIEPRCHRIEPSQGNKGLLETRIDSIGEDLGVERCSV